VIHVAREQLKREQALVSEQVTLLADLKLVKEMSEKQGDAE
jgi:hypothetical protein